ncbi:MAG: hypothetical protein QOD12_849 [Verrucomicrobiota bacterium]|jgi:hypothetical protein
MILQRDNGPVAEWAFENSPIHRLRWATLEHSLRLCEKIVSILHTHKILYPDTVRLSQWIRAGDHGVAQGERVSRTDTLISLSSSDSFQEVFSSSRFIVEKEEVYPVLIDISGSGVLVTEQGDTMVEDLAWIRATTLDILTITVATQCDAWLPFTLKGEPQPDIYRLNADRLATALQAIQRQTGLKLEEGATSTHAIMKGFRLENLRYADGSIADAS